MCLAAPALLLALSFAELPGTVLNILYVALGLGLVIFFHELGHFAVAKWCDVYVERFSIGFGPILWAKKWGETEYALSAIPFGGYVKMLGQDDMDPSQLTSEEMALDPRSYSAKPVWQRMAIISAGVTMNILTAILFFAAAYGLGVTEYEPVAGPVVSGGAAWRAGMQTGDRITAIDGDPVKSFADVTREVVLSSGPIRIGGEHPDGTTFDVVLTPDKGTRRQIGMESPFSLNLPELQTGGAPVLPGSPAAKAEPPLAGGDKIITVNGRAVQSYAELIDDLARHRSEPVTLNVARGGGHGKIADRIDIVIGPNKARSLGARVEFGRIAAVSDGSSAAEAGFVVGDRITKIDGQDVGRQIDPLRLPYLFGEKAGQPVKVELQRQGSGGAPEVHTVIVVPNDRPGWTERPRTPNEPLSVPAIGIAFHLAPRVLAVAPGGPADKVGLREGDVLEKLTLVRPKGVAVELNSKEGVPVVVDLTREGKGEDNYAFAFTLLQEFPQRVVDLTFRRPAETGVERKTVRLTPWSDPDDAWFFPSRGFSLSPLERMVEAESVGQALTLGYENTKSSVVELYLTLRNLLTGELSIGELRGPIGIAEIAYKVAEQGFSRLLLFLGFLSVNLAVLNFLPIPVLDGGHMVFLIWEGVTRRKPSERIVAAATYAGMLFILLLMGTVIYLDLFVHRAFRGDG